MHQSDRTKKRPWRIRLSLESLFTTEQFTFVQIKKMFIPLLIDQLFIFLMGILSSAMVSSSGEAAISAVTMVGSVGFIVSSLFGALSTGGTILVAQSRGSGDEEKVRVSIGQTILLTSVVSLVCSVVFYGFAEPLVLLLYPKAEPLLLEYAIHYLELMSISYIPFAVFSAIFGVFRGLGDSKSSLVLTVTINSVHLVASFILIESLQMGVTGAGLAYIFARAVGAVVAVVWMFFIRRDIGMHARYVFRIVRDIQKRIVKLGIPLAVEQVLFQAGMLLTQVFIATLPTSTIAANAIAGSAFGLFNAVAFTITTMVTTVCGQCIGAKRSDLASKYATSFSKAGSFVLLAALLVIGPLMPLLLKLYNPSAEALPLIYLAMAIGALPMPLLWCPANVPGAAMRAAGDAMSVTVISLASMWVMRVMAGYLLAIPLGLGVAGVWMSLVLEWMMRAALLLPRLRSGKWLAKVDT